MNIDFKLKNELAKTIIIKKLKDLLSVTSNIKTKVQLKIKIVKQYVLSQIRFELKTYNFGSTWIDQNLDSLVVKYVRDWLEMPISGCVKEMMTLPVSKGNITFEKCVRSNVATETQCFKIQYASRYSPSLV